MSDPARSKEKGVTNSDKHVDEYAHDDEHLEDEEKILAGRHDVNYPALLTKDVPGG